MNRNPKSEVRSPNWQTLLASLALALTGVPAASGAEPAADLLADRAAIERVYYTHRLGNKPPFEEVLPPEQLRRLVELDLAKEAALKKVYGVQITDALVQAEVQRINTTTRAPDVLAELKAALGNDTNRFARTVAKPIVVERLLRERFDNDDALNASSRREAEKVREQLLAARSSRGHEAPSSKPELEVSLLTSAATSDLVEQLLALLKRDRSNDVTETTWQLGARPAEKPQAGTPDAGEIRQRFGPAAQVLSPPPAGGKERKLYFADLPEELQRVLRVQLRQPGDVSAVIETPGAFLLYVCKEKTRQALSAATFSVPKRNYEEWLAQQGGDNQ